ncbi:MAG: hypothetical protein J0M10_09455 [Chitinophagales bacterium]|nr:hypothetical protein [Chitinophagales bacterium]
MNTSLKYKTLLLSIVCFTVINLSAQHVGTDYSGNFPLNFIRTWDALAPETDANTLMNRELKAVRQTTQYFDGLGRPLQTVIKQGSKATGAEARDL